MKHVEWTELDNETHKHCTDTVSYYGMRQLTSTVYGSICKCKNTVYLTEGQGDFIDTVNLTLKQFPSFIKTEIDALELLHLLDVSHNNGKLVGKQELQRSINEMLGN